MGLDAVSGWVLAATQIFFFFLARGRRRQEMESVREGLERGGQIFLNFTDLKGIGKTRASRMGQSNWRKRSSPEQNRVESVEPEKTFVVGAEQSRRRTKTGRLRRRSGAGVDGTKIGRLRRRSGAGVDGLRSSERSRRLWVAAVCFAKE